MLADIAGTQWNILIIVLVLVIGSGRLRPPASFLLYLTISMYLQVCLLVVDCWVVILGYWPGRHGTR